MFVAILQARMASRRLPGKAMAPLAGEPMIWRQVERLRRARRLSRVMVATSDEACDDAFAGYLVSRGQGVFRGDATDLLARYARCAQAMEPATHVVRIKGDAPFIDPILIDDAIRLAQLSGAAYVSNRQPRLHPAGLEVEVIQVRALIHAADQARDPASRVSPTAFIRSRPDLFDTAHLPPPPRDLSAWNWRVKTAADLAFARGVYDALHAADPDFCMRDVLDLVDSRHDLARFAA
jgi:spore coat polysaccharide biosynthesis protein SpsF